jgi:DNA-binding PucR family transcriptional regulator
MSTTIYKLLADDLARDMEGFIDEVAQRTLGEVPELLEDPERYAFARTSSRALMTDFVSVLELGVVDTTFHAPTASLALAQRFARDGIPVARMLRAYHLGQELVFERAARVAEQIPEPEDRSRAIAALGALSFRYIDGVMSDVTLHYDTEREQGFRSRDARRTALIHDLLAGAPVDVDQAERVLGYRVDGMHQAVVVWRAGGMSPGEAVSTEDADESLATAASTIAAELGEGRTLIVPDPAGHVTVWVKPAGAKLAPAKLEDLAPGLSAVSIQATIGRPARGLSGLASTKRQADLARGIAELHPGVALTHYDDVALASVLLRDQEAARAFADEELGGLAQDSRSAATLRATLAAYYAAGQDQSRTARKLAVHRNTVANRLRRAEHALGRRADQRARETEAALTILGTLLGR